MKKTWIMMTLAAAIAGTVPAMADWTGKGEAGIAVASGNTDTKSANAKIALGNKHDQWEELATLAGNYVRTAGDTTAKRWEVGLQERYNFAPKTFWYGGLRYEEDKFSGFDHQGVVSTGVGHKFIDNDTTHLSGQVGLGYKFYKTIATPLVPADKNSKVVGVAGLDFDQKLSDTTKVFDKASVEVASGNKFFQNEIGLAVKMSDRLALSLAYAVRHNTDPPAGFKKTDTLSTLNLVYEVK
ncbi:MAG: DUF481 domain-containing protein [Steroidobacteraceae bacterium]